MKYFSLLLLLSPHLSLAVPACEEYFRSLQNWKYQANELASRASDKKTCLGMTKKNQSSKPAFPVSCAPVTFSKMPPDFQSTWLAALGPDQHHVKKGANLSDLSRIYIQGAEKGVNENCLHSANQALLRKNLGGPHPQMSPDPR